MKASQINMKYLNEATCTNRPTAASSVPTGEGVCPESHELLHQWLHSTSDVYVGEQWQPGAQ